MIMENVKKILIILLLSIIMIFCTNIDVYAGDIIKGDINLDGRLSAIDLAKLNLHIVKINILTGESFNRADLNNDGKITAIDLAKLNRLLVGLGDRDITDEEYNSITRMICDNNGEIKYIPEFNSFRDIELEELFSFISNNERFSRVNKNYNEEQLMKMYIDYTGVYAPNGVLAGAPVQAICFSDMKAIVKDLSNKEIDRDWLDSKLQLSVNDRLVYIEEYDLILYHQDGPDPGYNEKYELSKGYVIDNLYILYIVCTNEYDSSTYTTKLALQQIDGKYYLVSNVRV